MHMSDPMPRAEAGLGAAAVAAGTAAGGSAQGNEPDGRHRGAVGPVTTAPFTTPETFTLRPLRMENQTNMDSPDTPPNPGGLGWFPPSRPQVTSVSTYRSCCNAQYPETCRAEAQCGATGRSMGGRWRRARGREGRDRGGSHVHLVHRSQDLGPQGQGLPHKGPGGPAPGRPCHAWQCCAPRMCRPRDLDPPGGESPPSLHGH